MRSSMLNKYNSTLHYGVLLRLYKVKVEILRTYGGNQKSIGPPGKAKRKAFHFIAVHWSECMFPAVISSLAESSKLQFVDSDTYLL